jgi:hypothetical protein
MERFRGRAHVPGVDKNWNLEVELDWDKQEAIVHIPEALGVIKTWPGLVVQTFGTYELVFKTKGIPPLFTHWWHIVRANPDELWGIVVGLPDKSGKWTTCPLSLIRISKLR